MNEFWLILKSQPGVGVLIVDHDGVVLFCNEQAKEIYYGHNFNPVGMTIEEVEGPEFAAERMPVIHKVIPTGEPIVLRHVRGGKHTEALIWPMQKIEGRKERIIAITRQLLESDSAHKDYESVDSGLVDLGPLDALTRREIEVLALVGHGMPLNQSVAAMSQGCCIPRCSAAPNCFDWKVL